MALYAVLNEHGNPIAYHERLDVVRDYKFGCKQQKYRVVRVKHPKRVEDTLEYAELYLTRVGEIYVPAKYYESADIIMTDELESYYRITDTITKNLEFEKLDRKTQKALIVTLGYFENKIQDIRETPIPEEDLRRFNTQYLEYREKLDYL